MCRAWWVLLVIGCDGGLDAVDTDDPVDRSPERACGLQLETTLPLGYQRARVAGAFNGWQPQEMEDDDGDGIWRLHLPDVEAGTWPYKFLWDDTWEEVPEDVPTAWQDGVENRAARVEDCREPALRITEVRVEDGIIHGQAQWYRAAGGAGPDPSTLTIRVGGAEVDGQLDEAGVVTVQVAGLDPGKHSLHVQLADLHGNAASAWAPAWVEDRDFAWGDGVMYQVFVDRFRDGGDAPVDPIDPPHAGTGYHGGDLVGARSAIEDGTFESLGVRSVWLSPVYENPEHAHDLYTGYHGYWPTDPRAVEQRFGTVDQPADEALHALVRSAHQRGMRVIFDVVLNHVHEDHPYIEQHPEWFDLNGCVCGDPGCDWEEKARTCWFAEYLPDLDYRHAGLVDLLVDDLISWVETYDIDGLRIDAAKHMDHVIMRTLSLRLQERYADVGGAPVYLIGETFTGAGAQDLIMEYVADHELDGQFDFPLLWRVRDAVRSGGSFVPLAAEVRRADGLYGTDVHGMSVFLGNHDVARIASELQGCDVEASFWGDCTDVLGEQRGPGLDAEQQDLVRRLSVAWAFVLTQPGPPLIYYGDELGLAGGEDPDNRRMMPTGDLSDAQTLLRDRVAALGSARAGSVALGRGTRRELDVGDDHYVFARVHDEQVAVIWMTRDRSGSTRLPVPVDLVPEGTTLRSALSGSTWTTSGGGVTVEAQPWSYDVLVSE